MATTFVAATKFIAIDKFTSVVTKMEKSVGGFNKKISNSIEPLNNFFKIGFAGVIATGSWAISQFISEASKIEDAVAGFTPILGSIEKANKLVDMLNKTAATTPFRFNDIADVANQLLPLMNGDLEKTVSTFRMLGDTAKGNSQKLESITRGYSKVLGKGKADMEALNMITEAGVPIMDQLSKKMGVSIAKLYEMSSQGKISANDITEVFKTMTSEGGIFFKGMEIASKTWSGFLSTLKDNISLSFASIGTAMLPILKEYLVLAINHVGKIKEWIDSNQKLISIKVKEYIEKISYAIKFLINNGSTILQILKWITISFIVLKTYLLVSRISFILLRTAIIAYNIAIGITGALTGKASIAIGRNAIAMGTYKAVLWLTTAAQSAWAAAVNAGIWPILAIIAAVVSIIGILTHLDDIIGDLLVQWNAFISALKRGDIMTAFKAIGNVIITSFILPIKGLLYGLSIIPGAVGRMAQSGLDKLDKLKFDISAPEAEKPINPEAATIASNNKMIEKTNNAKVQVEVKAAPGTEANIGNTKDISARVTNTIGWVVR